MSQPSSRRSSIVKSPPQDYGSESNAPSSDPIHYDSTIGSQKSNKGLSQLFSDSSSQLAYDTSKQQKSQSGSFYRRVDIEGESKLLKQINIESNDSQNIQPASSELDSQHSQSTQSSSMPQLVIWGTDVSINHCKKRFKQFLYHKGFDLNSLAPDEVYRTDSADLMEIDLSSQEKDKPYYIMKLQDIYTLEDPFLDINCAHVMEFDPDFYRQLVSYPQEVIPACDMAANEVYVHLYPQSVLPHHINIRPYNVIKSNTLRDLNPEDINQLKTISGMVIRCSNIIPEMREAFFQCSVCLATTTVEVDRGRIAEPSHCENCNTKHSHVLVHNRCVFIDKQQIKLQESPDDMPAGQTPYTVLLYVCADLVDSVQPGDRVTVTGIYRATAIRTNPRQRSVKSIYRTHIDVVHFRKIDQQRILGEAMQFYFTPERVDKLKTLSRLPDIYERLAHGIAPSIYEHEDIKKGILLQLFGGTSKSNVTNEDLQQKHFRSEINILLCGDPGTSKSQLLQYVYNLVPRGQYTSGKGSSAVGLTAYIVKDPDSKQPVLQTGALVLADGGICCIDEFDKMSDSTRSILHEVMEQQTLSIAKAGIVCQLNARTCVLAAANPVESQWNKNKTIIENIQLPHTLLSRFDLIFLLLDPQDEVYDKRLARHLVSLYYKTHHEEEEESLDIQLIKDYISYARNFVMPRLSSSASQTLIDSYVEMRKAGSGKGQVSAYPRQIESLIRLAEARAKVRLSNSVEIEDVEEAKRLHREAIKQSATDPLSGKIDLSILTTGISSSMRKRRSGIAKALKNLLSGYEKEEQFSVATLFSDLKSGSDIMITKEMFEDVLKDLQDEGFLVVLANKFVRLCGI